MEAVHCICLQTVCKWHENENLNLAVWEENINENVRTI
jgi:hypothetical protein